MDLGERGAALHAAITELVLPLLATADPGDVQDIQDELVGEDYDDLLRLEDRIGRLVEINVGEYVAGIYDQEDMLRGLATVMEKLGGESGNLWLVLEEKGLLDDPAGNPVGD